MTQPTLTGKSALITGASRGIGFAVAQRLGQLGARIAICGRDQNALEAACTRLRGQGIDALAVSADVSHSGQVSSLAEKALARFTGIDFLINNAGIGRFGPLQDFSEGDWDTVLDTNLKGVFLVSRAVIPSMISRGRGHIVNISSLAGKNFFPGGGLYCASKWGLLGLTYCMGEDLRAHGIRVTAVCPGSVATEFGHPSAKNVHKMLQPHDVAHAVEMIITAEPQSFISEVVMRPT
ncbi:MAG TPA: SDR family NAD(P)-dependent oxidoreductase, partial [Candidatus Acidoferrales bacterium]|nr:SDR family NAD(P)-dependent oxidoreductase [Candidatus Acidoferrales bacterium]